MDWRAKSGRVVPGVELRIVDDDGHDLAVGRRVGRGDRGARTVDHASYWRDPAPEKFHDGWLRTGDVGTMTPNGYLQITDRAKDVIKSGGEWISSVELENALMGHPAVVEAAVVGIPDRRWDERPLACVVADADVDPEDADGVPRRPGREVAGAGQLGVRRRDPEDVGRQVRQEGVARAVREGRAHTGTGVSRGRDATWTTTRPSTSRSSGTGPSVPRWRSCSGNSAAGCWCSNGT